MPTVEPVDTPLEPVREQVWDLYFHHPVPHPMRAVVRIRFAASHPGGGGCHVARSTTSVRRTGGTPPGWTIGR